MLLSSAVFMENTADYFGLPKPSCLLLRGLRVPGARGADRTVGPRGEALMSATMTGDGWRTQHDVGKTEAWRACNDHASRARMEVRGLFADVLDLLRRRFAVAFSSVSEFRRAGAVVDIAAYVDDGGDEAMFEVKAMHANPACYRCCYRWPLPSCRSLCLCALCRCGVF